MNNNKQMHIRIIADYVNPSPNHLINIHFPAFCESTLCATKSSFRRSWFGPEHQAACECELAAAGTLLGKTQNQDPGAFAARSVESYRLIDANHGWRLQACSYAESKKCSFFFGVRIAPKETLGTLGITWNHRKSVWLFLPDRCRRARGTA